MFEIDRGDSRDYPFVQIRRDGWSKTYNTIGHPDWQHQAQVWACNQGVYSAAEEFRAFIGVEVSDFAYPLPAADFKQGKEAPPILSDADLMKDLEYCYARGRRHFFDRLRALIDSRE